jgi:hypothetical protein
VKKKTQLVLETKKDGVYQQVPLISSKKIVSHKQKQFIQRSVDSVKLKICLDLNNENA